MTSKKKRIAVLALAVSSLGLLLLGQLHPRSQYENCIRESSRCRLVSVDGNELSQQDNSHVRIVYYNTHGGTLENMKAIVTALKERHPLKLVQFDPSKLSGYGMSDSRAKQLIRHADWICSNADVLVIADTIPHGRALLDALPHKCSNTRIIVEMTNRFDWDVADTDHYYDLFRRLVAMSRKGGELHGRLFFVANNLAEGRWMESRLGVQNIDVKLLRPMGIAGEYPYPEDLPKQNASSIATQVHKTNIHNYLIHELNLTLTLFPFGHKYGGPRNLLEFAAFLEFPYQFSTMKFYENIAAGVPTVIPSPRFLQELHYSGLHLLPIWYSLDVLDLDLRTKRYSSKWAQFVDYYAPEFAPFVYMFDSFAELVSILEMDAVKLDYKNVREKGPAFYKEYRNLIVEGWEQVLFG